MLLSFRFRIGDTPAGFACSFRFGLWPYSNSKTNYATNSLHKSTIIGLRPQMPVYQFVFQKYIHRDPIYNTSLNLITLFGSYYENKISLKHTVFHKFYKTLRLLVFSRHYKDFQRKIV